MKVAQTRAAIRIVMRIAPSLALIASSQISDARADESSDGCDLSELIPSLALETRTSGSGEVESTWVPLKPWLVPCDCEIDPWLRAVESRDPLADAKSDLESGEVIIYGELVIGDVSPVGLDDDEALSAHEIALKMIPGILDIITCYEQERLERVAIAYAEKYNRAVIAYLAAREEAED